MHHFTCYKSLEHALLNDWMKFFVVDEIEVRKECRKFTSNIRHLCEHCRTSRVRLPTHSDFSMYCSSEIWQLVDISVPNNKLSVVEVTV